MAGALPQCPALLTLGFPVAGLSQKHALLFEVIIGKADLLLAAALSSSLCGVLPRAVMNTRKHSLLLAFLLLSPSHIFLKKKIVVKESQGKGPTWLMQPLVPERPTQRFQRQGFRGLAGN